MRRTLVRIKLAIAHKLLKGKFYRKSLLFILMIACIPTAVVGVVLYLIGTPRIESEFNEIHQQQLIQSSNRIDEAFSELELVASQWAFNPIFGNELRGIDLRDQFPVTQNLYRNLTVMKGSNPLIGQVHLYLQHVHAVISDVRGVTPITDESGQSFYQSLVDSKRSVFWTDFPSVTASEQPEGSEMTLVLKLPGGGVGQVYGLLIVYLDPQKVDQLIANFSEEMEGASLLLNADGKWISNGHGKFGRLTEFESALRDEVKTSKTQVQSMLYSWNKKTYSVSYRTFDRLDTKWVYATATPLARLTAPVLLLSRIIISVSGLALAVAVLISWFGSMRLYQPVRRLIDLFGTHRDASSGDTPLRDEFQYIERRWRHLSKTSEILQQKLEQQLPILRHGFLLQLVQGHLDSLSEAELLERMGQYGRDFRGMRLAVMMIKLIEAAPESGKFREGEERLVAFAAGNVVAEMIRLPFCGADIIDFQDLSIGVLLPYPESLPDHQAKHELLQLAHQMTQTLGGMLAMDIAVSLGQRSSELQRLPELFEEARRLLQYRDINRSRQVLDADSLMPRGNRDVFYPFEWDKRIIQAIRVGDEAEALASIQHFVSELQTRSGEELHVRQAFVQLLGNIQFAILQSGFDPHEIFGSTSLIDQFNQLHSPELMIHWFQNRVIRPFIDAMRKSAEIESKLLVEKAIRTLEDQYSSDISLEYCADLLGTYPQKLSVAFKRITGTNFIDYLTQLRLEKSMMLLAQTEDKINDIAERVGYQPSYYNRLFKRHLRMTPGQYREAARQQSYTSEQSAPMGNLRSNEEAGP
ncbi:helix-turn-helix domain-containing protein [Paenibacillus koleovorans]|uniref:helix-turn-helix domain-containing protein n=1 Tax=Paenibacillus koleovorans TaxID=121608 RepID=UPI000FD70357|nr:helix-turn-helix domain-containing protein [Paenibacillus koleovorans]